MLEVYIGSPMQLISSEPGFHPFILNEQSEKAAENGGKGEEKK